jgi:hypothetical protein
MGFFSGMFGSKSEWDGSRYVENIAGTKFWHEHFIDKDEMKNELKHFLKKQLKDPDILPENGKSYNSNYSAY